MNYLDYNILYESEEQCEFNLKPTFFSGEVWTDSWLFIIKIDFFLVFLDQFFRKK